MVHNLTNGALARLRKAPYIATSYSDVIVPSHEEFEDELISIENTARCSLSMLASVRKPYHNLSMEGLSPSYSNVAGYNKYQTYLCT